eukprot:Awhi_evm1s5763
MEYRFEFLSESSSLSESFSSSSFLGLLSSLLLLVSLLDFSLASLSFADTVGGVDVTVATEGEDSLSLGLDFPFGMNWVKLEVRPALSATFRGVL